MSKCIFETLLIKNCFLSRNLIITNCRCYNLIDLVLTSLTEPEIWFQKRETWSNIRYPRSKEIVLSKSWINRRRRIELLASATLVTVNLDVRNTAIIKFITESQISASPWQSDFPSSLNQSLPQRHSIIAARGSRSSSSSLPPLMPLPPAASLH